MQTLFNCILLLMGLCLPPKIPEASIAVFGPHVPEEITRQAQLYAQHLGIDQNVYIVISFSRNIPSGVSGCTRYRNIEHYNDSHQVHITISPDMNRVQQMRTLAHEMVHAKQFVEGELVRCDDRHYSWGEGICLDIKRISYYSRPWEKEAHKLGNLLYYTYKKASN